MNNDIEKVLYSEENIQATIAKLADGTLGGGPIYR